MRSPETPASHQAALAVICELLEDNAPLAARWYPDEPAEAAKVLRKMRSVGLAIAAHAHAAIIQTRRAQA